MCVKLHASLAPHTAVLHPQQGNLHCLSTDRGATLLDFLTPAYDVNGKRPCTYYTAISAINDNKQQWLRPSRQPPSHFSTKTRPYRGESA